MGGNRIGLEYNLTSYTKGPLSEIYRLPNGPTYSDTVVTIVPHSRNTILHVPMPLVNDKTMVLPSYWQYLRTTRHTRDSVSLLPLRSQVTFVIHFLKAKLKRFVQY